MTEQPKDIVLSNNDMHPAEEIAHLKDLLGKANALARIRAERIKELEAQAGAEPVALSALEEDAANLLFALHDAWPYVHQWCTIKSRKENIQRLMQKHGDFADIVLPAPAREPLTDEQMDAVIEAAHHSLRQYKYSVRGQQITQFDGIEAHVIRETEAAHGIGGKP